MQYRVRGDWTQGFCPLESPSKISGLASVVLWTESIGAQLQKPRIYLNAVRLGCAPVGEIYRGLNHPLKRDVRQPRLVLRIASADVGVHSGKPDLVQPIGVTIGPWR